MSKWNGNNGKACATKAYLFKAVEERTKLIQIVMTLFVSLLATFMYVQQTDSIYKCTYIYKLCASQAHK